MGIPPSAHPREAKFQLETPSFARCLVVQIGIIIGLWKIHSMYPKIDVLAASMGVLFTMHADDITPMGILSSAISLRANFADGVARDHSFHHH